MFECVCVCVCVCERERERSDSTRASGDTGLSKQFFRRWPEDIQETNFLFFVYVYVSALMRKSDRVLQR